MRFGRYNSLAAICAVFFWAVFGTLADAQGLTGLTNTTRDEPSKISEIIEKAAESGKPENVQEKMVDGAIKKFAKENALLSQMFVMDNKASVEDVKDLF